MKQRFWPHAVLSIFLAAIPVLAVAAPKITAALAPRRSHFEFAFQGANYDKLTAFVFNTGGRPGTVDSVILKVGGPKGVDEHWLYTAYAEENASLGDPVQPGDHPLIAFVKAENKLGDLAGKAQCTLTFHAINSDSTEQTATQTVDCHRVELLSN